MNLATALFTSSASSSVEASAGEGKKGAPTAVDRMYALHLRPLQSALIGSNASSVWRIKDPKRRVFDALLRSAAGCAGPH